MTQSLLKAGVVYETKALISLLDLGFWSLCLLFGLSLIDIVSCFDVGPAEEVPLAGVEAMVLVAERRKGLCSSLAVNDTAARVSLGPIEGNSVSELTRRNANGGVISVEAFLEISTFPLESLSP